MKRKPFPAHLLEPTQNTGRFAKGRSGNPKGRPKGSALTKPHVPALDIVMNKMLTVTRNGVEQEISAEEALQQQVFRSALAGKRADQAKVRKWIAKRDAWLEKHAPKPEMAGPTLRITSDPRNADEALLLLGIPAENPARAGLGLDRKQLLLEPWAVQLALNRRKRSGAVIPLDARDVGRCTRDDQSLKMPKPRRRDV